MSIKRLTLLLSLSIALLFSPTLASANVPGGGTGKGPDVTVTDNGDGTVTMANGVVSIPRIVSKFNVHIASCRMGLFHRPSFTFHQQARRDLLSFI